MYQSNRRSNNRFRGQNRQFRPQRKSGYKFGKRDYSLDKLVRKAVDLPPIEVVEIKNTFTSFDLSDKLKANIKQHGYETPTPIQDQGIPEILNGRDVVGIANTGTGKTAAFLLPLINKIYLDRQQKVLIITPTRELAVQIQDEAKQFATGLGIYTCLIIGGASMLRQKQELQRRPQIVIGTPGRLKDLNNQRVIDFNYYHNIVLDEVDRMLDMGFIHDVKAIISQLPQERQSLFFSATMTPEVVTVMKSFLHDPVTVSVKTHETAINVDQDIIKLGGRNKIEVLHELLIQKGFDKVLIFGRTKWGIEKLTNELNSRGFKAASLHGNKSQSQRQAALKKFKSNEVNILLATDVASRGLDISGVTHVINYDLPDKYEDYVHRIGRTGRAGKKGIALSLVD